MPAKHSLPEEPMHGLGDLALALGGSEDSFTGQLLRLIAKADAINRDRLRLGFPRAVRAWELWMVSRPTPTAAELLAVLDLPPSENERLTVEALLNGPRRRVLGQPGGVTNGD